MQINRLFEIVYILLENSRVTAAALAKRFEVSVRTIYRDVEALSQAGIPIYMCKGKGGGIFLLPDFILNKAVLTQQEKNDVLAALQAVNAVKFSDDSALRKLNTMLGSQQADWIEVDFSSWGYFANEADYFEQVKTAILSKKMIAFWYASGKSEKLFRKVMPLKLVFKGSAWYLYGWCTLREDYRFFKLRRIDSLTLTAEHFEKTAPAGVSLLPKVDTSRYIKAVYKISSLMTFRVYDEISSYTTDENGDFICEIYLPDISTVCGYAASFGEFCTILSPETAAAAMKERLKKILHLYK